jgi:valyl-tRNA synthetase
MIERGEGLHWVPGYMRHRFTNWVEGLNGDWLVSRQRFFGVPFPVWYRLDDAGLPVYDDCCCPMKPTCRSTRRPRALGDTTSRSAVCPVASPRTPT